MAKVFIPQVGDKIELSKNWNCKIFNERRNSSVFEALGVDVSNQKDSNIDITFPKGTVFKVSRLYVRAPASSFDSITLAVVSSPIKKLSKAKFWVKIMDANNMEFDSKELTFNDFDSISSLFRHLVLKDGHTTDQNFKSKDRQPYMEQILSHFYQPEKAISFEVTLSKEDILKTCTIKNEYSSWKSNNQEFEDEKSTLIAALPQSVTVKVTMYPALNGMLFKFDTVEAIKQVDLYLNYFDTFYGEYSWRIKRLGSYLSYDYLYHVDNLKKEKVTYLAEALAAKADFHVEGKVHKFKNMKEFNKFLVDLETSKDSE